VAQLGHAKWHVRATWPARAGAHHASKHDRASRVPRRDLIFLGGCFVHYSVFFSQTSSKAIFRFSFRVYFILLDYAIGLKLILSLIHSINSGFFYLNSPLLFLIILGFVMVIGLNVVVVVKKMILG